MLEKRFSRCNSFALNGFRSSAKPCLLVHWKYFKTPPASEIHFTFFPASMPERM